MAAYRETLLEASRIASDLADAELAARAALANNRGFASASGRSTRSGSRAIERALELDDPPQPARRARLLATAGAGAAVRPGLHASLCARRGGDLAGAPGGRSKDAC